MEYCPRCHERWFGMSLHAADGICNRCHTRDKNIAEGQPFLTVQLTTRLRKFTRHGPFRTLRAATPAAHDLPTCLPQSVSDLTNSPTEISDH